MFDVHVDFNEASREWRANKVPMGKGYFRYKCLQHGCEEELYVYTAQSPYFDTFATDFDRKYRRHPLRIVYCEEHLLQHGEEQMFHEMDHEMDHEKEHALEKQCTIETPT